jgi:hypothetical protein
LTRPRTANSNRQGSGPGRAKDRRTPASRRARRDRPGSEYLAGALAKAMCFPALLRRSFSGSLLSSGPRDVARSVSWTGGGRSFRREAAGKRCLLPGRDGASGRGYLAGRVDGVVGVATAPVDDGARQGGVGRARGGCAGVTREAEGVAWRVVNRRLGQWRCAIEEWRRA